MHASKLPFILLLFYILKHSISKRREMNVLSYGITKKSKEKVDLHLPGLVPPFDCFFFSWTVPLERVTFFSQFRTKDDKYQHNISCFENFSIYTYPYGFELVTVVMPNDHPGSMFSHSIQLLTAIQRETWHSHATVVGYFAEKLVQSLHASRRVLVVTRIADSRARRPASSVHAPCPAHHLLMFARNIDRTNTAVVCD